ncbi:hypothetical protein Tco_0956645 [Tanacetum coccineum]
MRSVKISSRPSTHTFSPPPRLLQSPVKLWVLGSVLEPFSLSVDLIIKSLSVTQAEVFHESLKFLQLQLFKSLEDWEVSSLQFMQRYRN